MPDKNKLSQYKTLKVFGKFIQDPNLWHLNRYSIARAFSVGLFFAWCPVPFQMLLAALGAILFNCNLPLSIALVWITNPITMPPLYFFAYKVGGWVMGTKLQVFKFQFSVDWLMSIGKPFLLGCLIMGIISAVLGNIIIRILWSYSIRKSWKNRKLRRRAHTQSSKN